MGTVRALGKGGTSLAGEPAQASGILMAGQGASPATPTAEMAGLAVEPEPLHNRGMVSPLRAYTAGHQGVMKMAEVPTSKKVLVAAITLLMLAGGLLMAASLGNLSMRPGVPAEVTPVQARAK